MIIVSKDNETIKNIRKLKEKKYRDENNLYIIEGVNLIKEAIDEKANIETIVICEEYLKDTSIISASVKYNSIDVDSKVFDSISDVKNPQGILAVIKKENAKSINYDEDIIVILEDIQDPGNLGTIIRTIDSAGLSQIIVSANTTDVFNSKVVRSTMGAIFRVNVIESNNLEETIKEIEKNKFKICATSLEKSKSIYDIEYKKIAIIIGNESNGVSKELLELAKEKIKIPMIGKTESLNASVATGVILYEYVRQKLDNK